jgi:tRNA A-37 threonylcarbamoyl transferase component Bud32
MGKMMDKTRKKQISSFLSSHFDTFNMIPIKKNKVYRIETEGLFYRFDPNYSKRILEIHRVLLENNVNVAKIIDVKEFEDSGYVFKLSQWIQGSLWKEVAEEPKLYYLLGEQVAKMNLTKFEDGFIGCTDINSSGVVYNGSDVYLIDLGRSKPKINPDVSVVQMLLKRVKIKDRINMILDGYSKYRSVDGIVSILKNINGEFKRDIRQIERLTNI